MVDLRRRFGETVALDGVTFAVPRGAVVGFVGRNGAGKTTAMRIALGVLAADAGEVRWRGAPVDRAVRRRFGYMPEERGLYPRMRVLEQLVYLGAAARDGRGGRAERGLGAHRRLQRGSAIRGTGSSRCRSATSSASSSPPRWSTSPTSSCSTSRSRASTRPASTSSPRSCSTKRGTRGVPVVFSSHQLELVERLCDAVVLIDRGRVVAEGSIDGAPRVAGAPAAPGRRPGRRRRLVRAAPGGPARRGAATGVVLELDERRGPAARARSRAPGRRRAALQPVRPHARRAVPRGGSTERERTARRTALWRAGGARGLLGAARESGASSSRR